MHAQFSTPKQPVLTVGLGLLFAGCNTTSYTVQVDAISQSAETATQSGRSPQSYSIRSHNPRVAEDSLRYKEVSDYVKTALSGKGLYEAPPAETADVIVEIDYGMETPRVKYETISRTVENGGRYETRQTMQYVRGGDGLYITVPVEESRYIPGEVKQVNETEPVIIYEKYLKVSARENKEASEGRAPAEVWSVNVSAEDQSQELRKYIPILASATADYIGTNTRESKPVTIDEKDEVVKFIKKGM